MIKLVELLTNENEFRTRKGTPIHRFKNQVGKAIGGQLYVHKNYAAEIIPTDVIEYAEGLLKRFDPQFEYNCIMLDLRRDEIRFDQSPDFDTAWEPHVGKFVKIDLKGIKPPYEGYSNSIWHHKWLWVRDDYTGFDVDKAKEWSKLWLSKLREPAKGTDQTWNVQLRQYGLNEMALPKGFNLIVGKSTPWRVWSRIGGNHNILGGGRGTPWRYNELTSTLYWMDSRPEEDEVEQVINHLEKAGYNVKREINLDDFISGDHTLYIKYNDAAHGIMDMNEQLLMESRATPKMLEAFLREQIKGSEWEGKVFLVGGFVRDELLGKEPKDADVVVGKFQGGVEFTTWLAKKLGIYSYETNPVIFPTFGTANLRLDGVVWNGIDFTGESVDAVMFRKEQYHDPNSRKPTVQFTPDISVDASRRDLTFNALYKDISSGQILDPSGKGMEDLKNGVIRTPIDPTIIYTDDALRMFRAVRFATQLGFELSPEVIDGIKKNLHRLGNTSRERVRDELNKILVSKNPARGIRLLRDTGLLPYVAPELQKAVGMIQNRHHTSDVFDHTLEVLKSTQPELVRRLMALFHDIGKLVTREETPTGVHFIGHEDEGPEIAERIMRDLKYPNELIDAVKIGIRHHMKLKHGGDDAVKISDKSLRKFKIAVGQNLDHVLDVIHADNTAHSDSSNMPNQIAVVRQRLQALDIKVDKPNLPINGNDLIKLGVKPGPKIGQILSAVTDAWFENPNISKDDAIAIAKQMI